MPDDPQPETDTEETAVRAGVPEPVSRGWADGWQWIRHGAALFRRNPLLWILGALLFFVVLALLNTIPLVGALAGSLLSPVLSGGFIYAFAREDRGERAEFPDLLAGFRRQTNGLISVGALFLLGEVLLVLVVVLLAVVLARLDLEQLMTADPAQLQQYGVAMALVALGFVLFLIPLLMAYWFAPALVIMDGARPLQAFRVSFDACLLNIPPFLLYGLVALLLFIIAALPMFLGLIVLVPIMMATQYTSYQSIFHGPRGALLP